MATPTEDFLLSDLSGLAQAYLNANMRGTGTVGGKENLSINQAGLHLTGYNEQTGAPDAGWGSVGQAYTITYGFRASAPSPMPADTAGFQRFNAAQIYQAEQALLAWADVANIHFNRAGSGTSGEGAYSNNAVILFGNYSSGESNAAAFAYFPGTTANAGDVWINIKSGNNASPQVGTYPAQVLVHEIGHTLGLEHPGDYDAHSDLPFSYGNDAEYFEDSRQYTVMSYFGEANTGGAYGGVYASAPQLDDIRAMQIEYGANTTTRAANTVYGFNSTAERAWFLAEHAASKVVFAVWDVGGIDTFDFNGFSQAQVIDLREGNFSDVGGLVGNVSIAQGVKIENVIGGSGADTITGNALDNHIDGRDGNDRILGEEGGDTLCGGAGNDVIDAGDGRNQVFGEDGDDYIYGGADADTLQGNAGADTISGGLGSDVLYGGRDNDYLFGDDGADFINGNLGDDTVMGAGGADTILGGQGADYISGGSGNDYLSGDRGNDTLIGGAGADHFRGNVGMGMDRIVDFNSAEGDQIVVDAGATYALEQSGSDTIVFISSTEDRFVVVNVQIASLTAGWIVYA